MTKTVQIVNIDARKRTWHEESEMLISLLDCVVLDNDAVYASSEFTTGRRFYDLCREYQVKTGEELKRRLGSEYFDKLLSPNKEEGIRFARKIREWGHAIVLTPNPFHAAPVKKEQNWSQTEYLNFWKEVISRKCSSVFFNEGWQFSNGCTFEYLAGVESHKKLFDHTGRPLELTTAMEMIEEAVRSLKKEGFEVPALEEVLGKLTSLPVEI